MIPADFTPVPWDRVPPTLLASPAALPSPVPLRAGGDARSAFTSGADPVTLHAPPPSQRGTSSVRDVPRIASLSGPPTAPPSVLHGAADGGAADWRRDVAGVAVVVTLALFLVGFDRLLWGA